jgi:hypothetical protein
MIKQVHTNGRMRFGIAGLALKDGRLAEYTLMGLLAKI